jgi:hypothetical protein
MYSDVEVVDLMAVLQVSEGGLDITGFKHSE